MGLPPIGSIIDGVSLSRDGAQGAPLLVLTNDEQRRFKKFRKWIRLSFKVEKEDAHEFLTMCREPLEIVALA